MKADKIIKDISYGVIVIDGNGNIEEINDSACKILHFVNDGNILTDLFLDTKNDEFTQIILDSAFSRKPLINRKIKYYLDNGQELVLNVKSSIVTSEQGEHEGIIVSFDDVTNEEKLLKNRKDSSFIFVIMTCFVCLSVYVYDIWLYFDKPLETTVLSKITVLVGAIICVLLMKKLNYSFEDIGLGLKNIKRNLVVDSLAACIAAVLLVLIKIIILKVNPSFSFYCADGKFFDFAKYTPSGYFLYALSVLAQEFESRGIVHESVKRIIDSKYSNSLAIIVSSLFFWSFTRI